MKNFTPTSSEDSDGRTHFLDHCSGLLVSPWHLVLPSSQFIIHTAQRPVYKANLIMLLFCLNISCKWLSTRFRRNLMFPARHGLLLPPLRFHLSILRPCLLLSSHSVLLSLCSWNVKSFCLRPSTRAVPSPVMAHSFTTFSWIILIYLPDLS